MQKCIQITKYKQLTQQYFPEKIFHGRNTDTTMIISSNYCLTTENILILTAIFGNFVMCNYSEPSELIETLL